MYLTIKWMEFKKAHILGKFGDLLNIELIRYRNYLLACELSKKLVIQSYKPNNFDY